MRQIPKSSCVIREKITYYSEVSFPDGPSWNSAVSEKPQSPRAASDSKRVQQLGDFELKRKLGKGGMGEVFLAHQVSLDRVVALKTLSKELAKREDFVKRFLREARAMAKLDHPNAVKVYAVDSFRGIHFAAIEYIDGQSIQNWIDQIGLFSVGDAVHVAIVCAQALQHAHEQNMIHRDIKPDNILVTKKGIVKVADFGLAKVIDDDVSMTQSGTGLGTPLYMAPEQARNAKHVDQRCDIYALGATLYHLLTGKLPFRGDSTLELIIAKEKGSYPSARSVRSEVPERLDLIIDKMMAKDPAHRYRSCEEVIRDLSTLGIHNETLSFIDGVDPPRAASGTAAPTLLSGLNNTAQTGRKTVAATAVRETGALPNASRVWYLQFEDAKGKTTVEKHTTGRVLKMIASGVLTAKARGKASADGSYMPLAQFPEFSEAIENQLARKTAAIRKEDMGSLYAKVARAEKNRYRWRSLKDFGRGLVGWTSLILWLAGIGLVAWLVVLFGGAKVKEAAATLGFSGPEQTAEKDPSKKNTPNSSVPGTP